jgi:adenosine deaminase
MRSGEQGGREPHFARADDDLRFLAEMPKAELHLHLDGSLNPSLALELAKTRGIEAPRDWAGMRAALVAPERCADQADLLRAFDLPIALLQDAEALELAADQLVRAKTAENVVYMELRWGPHLHTAKGLTQSQVIAAVAKGANAAAAACDVEVRLIITALRSHSVEENRALAAAAVAAQDLGVVGFDLAGREAAFPDPLTFKSAFDVARDGGLAITLHAGEWGGAAQVRRALDVKPARIAHGAVAVEDPALCDELIARGVVLDLCPSSNVQAAIVSGYGDFPILALHRRGLRVTLNTDDLIVSDLTLSEEYGRVRRRLGASVTELLEIAHAGYEAAFAPEPLREALLQRFDTWRLTRLSSHE